MHRLTTPCDMHSQGPRWLVGGGSIRICLQPLAVPTSAHLVSVDIDATHSLPQIPFALLLHPITLPLLPPHNPPPPPPHTRSPSVRVLVPGHSVTGCLGRGEGGLSQGTLLGQKPHPPAPPWPLREGPGQPDTRGALDLQRALMATDGPGLAVRGRKTVVCRTANAHWTPTAARCLGPERHVWPIRWTWTPMMTWWCCGVVMDHHCDGVRRPSQQPPPPPPRAGTRGCVKW